MPRVRNRAGLLGRTEQKRIFAAKKLPNNVGWHKKGKQDNGDQLVWYVMARSLAPTSLRALWLCRPQARATCS